VSEITLALHDIERGEPDAAARLLPLVYEELRKLAAARMAHEPPGLTLQPTALVHEAWLRIGGEAQPDWRSRAQFFSAAAEAMRRILIDHARRRRAQRHGGGQLRVDATVLDVIAAPANDDLLLAINDALEKLAVHHPQKAELVKLRYFAGLDHAETAQSLGISEITAKRWWSYARAWLYTELQTR
jgi:RNA polymerase sigma factor (TIGR02999 family)